MDKQFRAFLHASRKTADSKSWLPLGLAVIFVLVVCTSIARSATKEHVSTAAAANLHARRLAASTTDQGCGPKSRQTHAPGAKHAFWTLPKVIKKKSQGASFGKRVYASTADLERVVPQTVAPTPLHKYPGHIGSFHLMSAYHDSRFLTHARAPREDRFILLVLANPVMRKHWRDKDMRVKDSWNCLLCSFASELDPEAPDFTGPPPSMKFERPEAELLSCWWGLDPMRSFQWNDIHNLEFSVAQFECKAPKGVPVEKVSLATVANTRLRKFGKLGNVLFAPLEGMQPGMRKVAVPSFERFKRVHHIKYVARTEEEAHGSMPQEWSLPNTNQEEEEGTTSDGGNEIQKDRAMTNAKPRISLCVGPVFGRGSGFVEEWVAFQRMMGVNHFHVYYWDNPVMPTSPTLLKSLKYFSLKGFMTVYHVDMMFADPPNNVTGISSWLRAQATMLMDCYYRAAGTADFVGWLDTDEFLGPANLTHVNWFQTLDPLLKDPTLGTIMFPHWWYMLQDRKVNGSWLHKELVTASVFSRADKPLGYDAYSHPKCMARVGSVRLQSIHIPIIPVPGFRIEKVSPDVMFFRHYRKPDPEDGFNKSTPTSEDHSLLRFQERLHVAVQEIKEDVAN